MYCVMIHTNSKLSSGKYQIQIIIQRKRTFFEREGDLSCAKQMVLRS